ncbi:hypothetical protein [Staphylospora marina]|uniref:hypothetical protein n=1 Tax=Staphylospora marina TaxID=2490858 RepID=UPI000F5C1F8A|nr:hypothetical protein [Staphylospora marina]
MRHQAIRTLVLGSLLALAAGIWMNVRNRRPWSIGRLIDWMNRSRISRMLMSEWFWKRLLSRMMFVR